MATQVFIPYHFTKDSFRETCRKIHFFGSENHDFILSHQIIAENENNLLISVADLLQKKMELRLEEVISKLQNYHPNKRIIAKPLIFEALDIHTIEKHEIDYLAFGMDKLSSATKTSLILRRTSRENSPLQCYFQSDFWKKATINLLWVKKEDKGFSQISVTMDLETCFPCMQQEIQNASKTPFNSLFELKNVQNQYDLVVLKG
jgi:hypothetical protein